MIIDWLKSCSLLCCCLFFVSFFGTRTFSHRSLTRTSFAIRLGFLQSHFDRTKDTMTTTKSASESFNMDDFDALLAALSPEDLEKVNDLIDPEVSSIIFRK